MNPITTINQELEAAAAVAAAAEKWHAYKKAQAAAEAELRAYQEAEAAVVRDMLSERRDA